MDFDVDNFAICHIKIIKESNDHFPHYTNYYCYIDL